MTSTLFALRGASRRTFVRDTVPDAMYDPQEQILVWRGGTAPQAVYCSGGDQDIEGYEQCHVTGGQCWLCCEIIYSYGWYCD
jgi:1,4-dihydroxy-2-naphthoyl-CoA synthase